MSSSSLYWTDEQIANPPGPYDAADVPENPSGSRYAVSHSPRGIGMKAADNVALVYSQLLDAQVEAAEELPIPSASIQMYRLVKQDGVYGAVKTKVLNVKRTHKLDPLRGKIGSPGEGGNFTDKLVSGEWNGAVTDAQVVEGFVQLCQQVRAEGETLRKLSICLQRLLLRRAGAPLAMPFGLPV